MGNRTWLGWGSIVFVAALAALSGACVKKGEVAESTPMTQSMAAYKSAAVKIEGPTTEKNAAKNHDAFKSALAAKLKEAKLFSDVATDDAAETDLVIKVTVSKVDDGSALMSGVGGNAGSAEVALDVQFWDKKQGKSVGGIAVSGNSKKDTSMSVGGVNTDAVADRTGRAYTAAADQIVEYLGKHR